LSLITILGASGFIGSSLINRLQEIGATIYAPGRNESLTRKSLGNVIYAIGLTADFRIKPYDTIDAHVCKLVQVLRECEFESITYLSSTRIYGRNKGYVSEEDDLIVAPLNTGDLYNVSKLAGESILFSSRLNVHVVRLSNVYGYDYKSVNFLQSIVRDAIQKKHIVLNSALSSAKDYISIHNVVDMLIEISTKGQFPLYNLASGYNVSHEELINSICKVTGATFEVTDEAPVQQFPLINIKRVQQEFDFKPRNVLNDIPEIIAMFNKGGFQ